MKINLEPSLTFDDVLLEPRYSDFTRADVDTGTLLTPDIRLEVPFISSPMDTVTDSTLAITLGRLGAFGFIHRHFTIEDQVKQVSAIKAEGLAAGAAVSRKDFMERVAKLVDAGADAILVDSAHGDQRDVLDTIEKIKASFAVSVVSGNVATKGGARRSIEAGADALRVGVGPGSICTTRVVAGMGVPQLDAIRRTAKVARRHGIPLIADGGVQTTGDAVKALAAGGDAVMMGERFTGTDEACSKQVHLSRNQVPERFKHILRDDIDTYTFRVYRGMGSAPAMQAGYEVSSEEYHGNSDAEDPSNWLPEGVEGYVPEIGSAASLIDTMLRGLRSGMFYTGARTIPELHKKAKFQRITDASLQEGYSHDIHVVTG